jgi:hypothetical protein
MNEESHGNYLENKLNDKNSNECSLNSSQGFLVICE